MTPDEASYVLDPRVLDHLAMMLAFLVKGVTAAEVDFHHCTVNGVPMIAALGPANIGNRTGTAVLALFDDPTSLEALDIRIAGRSTLVQVVDPK